MTDESPFYCPAQTRPPRLYVDPEPAEWCDREVDEEGQYCPDHEDQDDDPWSDD